MWKTRLHVTRALKTHTYVFLNKVTSTLIWFTVNLQVEAKTMSKHIGEEFIIKPQRCTRWRRRTWKQAVNAYKLQSMYSKFKINQTLHLWVICLVSTLRNKFQWFSGDFRVFQGKFPIKIFPRIIQVYMYIQINKHLQKCCR